MPKNITGGGWHSIRYTMKMGVKYGYIKMAKSMLAPNACKTCALGMGGQKGGMTNEQGRFPELCKKSLQAMGSDMQKPIPDEFFQKNSLEVLKKMSPYELEQAGRLAVPLYKGQGSSHYQPLSWEQGLEKITTKMKNLPAQQSFFYVSGRSSNEAGFLLQLFARLWGTSHIHNCSYYCHQASGEALKKTIGTGTATIQLEDLENSDLVVLIGANPACNHPRFMSSLKRIKQKGGKVIVINPMVEPGLKRFRIPSNIRSMLGSAKISDLYIQPRIGGDIAFLTGVAKGLLERDLVDKHFIASHCEGWDGLQDLVQGISWEKIVEQSQVQKAVINQFVEAYGQSQGAVFAWAMGITHHQHGFENVGWIVNTALLRGMIGKKNAGLLPLRGHSNIQGMGTMGVTPKLASTIEQRLKEQGVNIPQKDGQGYDTMACMEAAARGDLKFGFCLGGNLYGSNPDLKFAAKSLENLEMMVYMNTTLNTGHAIGAKETLILPVRSRDEEQQLTTQESMFNYVRISEGGQERIANLKSELDIIADIADRVLGSKHQVSFKECAKSKNVRKLIGKVIPNFEKLADLDDQKKEFHIPGRTLHQARFPTPSGKAQFSPHEIPEVHKDQKSLTLMTVRSEGQFNTVVYEEEDSYRAQKSRHIILLNPEDMKERNLITDQKVTVKSSAGEMSEVVVRPWDIKKGSAAMYYPEANILVGKAVDPIARTPAFKAVNIHIL